MCTLLLGDTAHPALSPTTDPSYSKLTTSVLSTSNSGADPFELFAFGPVVGNGLGIGYQVFDGSISITVSSFEGKAEDYARELRTVFCGLRDMLQRDAA